MLLLENPKPQPLALVDHPVAFITKTKKNHPDKEAQLRTLDDLIAIKNSRHDGDSQKSKLFFFVGLVISLSVCLIAFEWKSYDRFDLINLGMVANDFDEILEIPPTEQTPPPPPQKTATPTLIAVADDEELKEIDIVIDAEINQKDLIQDVVFEEVMMEPEEEKVEEIFNIVENPAVPVGGMASFYAYIAENLEYPRSALRTGVSGKVFVQFVVEKDGTLSDVKILKGIEQECDKEALRVVKNAPKWVPAKQRGRSVRQYQRLPIVFKINDRN